MDSPLIIFFDNVESKERTNHLIPSWVDALNGEITLIHN